MTIGQGNSLTAVDITALVNLINNNDRGDSGDPLTVSIGDLIDNILFGDMVDKLVDINAIHCYCESDGSRDSGDTTKTGTTLTLTSDGLDHEEGDIIYATKVQEIDTDIDSLITQCDCDTYACNCDFNCDVDCSCHSECSCNDHACSCNTQACLCNDECNCESKCSVNCLGNTYGCSVNSIKGYPCADCCDRQCMCESGNCKVNCTCHSQCSCNTVTCNCDNGQACGCVAGNCTCNNECTTVCTCDGECICDKVCTCEYN